MTKKNIKKNEERDDEECKEDPFWCCRIVLK